jgi:hypothetical protein
MFTAISCASGYIEQNRPPCHPLEIAVNPPPFRIKADAGVYAGSMRWPYPCL